MNRRTLLVAAVAGGGLAVGWALWPRASAVNWAPAPGDTLLNAYVKIGADGRVVVAVAQAEMGQGIWSALAQIVADELGADWRGVGVEPAPLGPDYANPGLALGAAAGLSEPMRSVVMAAGQRVARFFDFQITGGSNSVRAWEPPLRAAAAAAREMLVKAAARRWDVDWQEIDTAGGFVTYKANRLPFHALVGEIDPDDAPADPELRTNGRLAGQALLRLDVPAKVDGSARFGIDVRLPGLAYAAIDQGPIGARVASHSAPALPAGVSIVAQSGFIACVADNWFAAHKALKSLSIKWQPAESAAGPWLEAAVRSFFAASHFSISCWTDRGRSSNSQFLPSIIAFLTMDASLDGPRMTTLTTFPPASPSPGRDDISSRRLHSTIASYSLSNTMQESSSSSDDRTMYPCRMRCCCEEGFLSDQGCFLNSHCIVLLLFCCCYFFLRILFILLLPRRVSQRAP